MPQRLVFSFAFAGFIAWSFAILFVWLLVNLGGDVLRLMAPVLFFGHPDGPSIVDAGARLLVTAGGWVVAAVWLAGCAVLAVVSWVLHSLAGGEVRVARFDYHYTRRSPEREMKDVTPPRAEPTTPQRQLPRPPVDQD
jgi:hypothetical protein